MSSLRTLLRVGALLCLLAPPVAATPLEDLQAQGRLEITAAISPDGMLVPGQKLSLTLEVATDRWFSGGTRIGIPEVAGLVILQTEQFASNASENRRGQSWVVQRWTLDVYPQRAGEFSIPPLRLNLQVNAGGDSGDVSGEIYSPGVSFSATLPGSLAEADHWVAAPEFTVNQRFDRSLEDLRVGDAFEREIRFQASDVMAMMLPPFVPRDQAGLASYPSPPQLENSSNRGQARASRIQRISYVVEEQGAYTFPQQEFFWWNTGSNELQLLTLPPVAFTVGGSAASSRRNELPVSGMQLLVLGAGVLVLLALAWLAWTFWPRALSGWVKTAVYNGRALWKELRNPALPQELNPGSSAGERKAWE